jgi:hypothetical protein
MKETATITGLAATETQRMEAALGDYILRFLRIRKGPKNDIYDVDAVYVHDPELRCYMAKKT